MTIHQPTPPRKAGAQRKGHSLLVHPVGTTVDGIGVHIPPVHRFESGVDAAIVGRALRDSLALSATRIPPRYWKEQQELKKEFLRSAGVRSWRQLDDGAVSCWIRETDGTIVLTPLRNGGTRGDTKGFQPFGAQDVTVSTSASDEALGAAIFEALDRSE